MKYINILFPVYNEQLRLEKGIVKTINYMEREYKNNYCLTIVDNASNDRTEEIAHALVDKYNQVKYIRLQEKGVGVAFRAGVSENTAPIVGYMDVDLSTDLKHLEEVIDSFKNEPQLGMVNGSRWGEKANLRSRKWYRQITSCGLVCLLKICLKMQASDAICGFKFFRKEQVERLIEK